jgi:hypothetical protein
MMVTLVIIIIVKKQVDRQAPGKDIFGINNMWISFSVAAYKYSVANSIFAPAK